MNKVILCGRAVKDAAISYTSGDNPMCIARFTIACDRRGKRQEGRPKADFPSCVAFGRTAEFCEKWVKKGMKFDIVGRLQTGSYKDKNGNTVYTTEVVVEDMEFGESKGAQHQTKEEPSEEWANVPEDIDSQLPFN